MVVFSAVDPNGSLGARIESEVFSFHVPEFVVFDVVKSEDQYKLSDFTFENLSLTAKKKAEIQKDCVEGFTLKNVMVNGKKVE